MAPGVRQSSCDIRVRQGPDRFSFGGSFPLRFFFDFIHHRIEDPETPLPTPMAEMARGQKSELEQVTRTPSKRDCEPDCYFVLHVPAPFDFLPQSFDREKTAEDRILFSFFRDFQSSDIAVGCCRGSPVTTV